MLQYQMPVHTEDNTRAEEVRTQPGGSWPVRVVTDPMVVFEVAPKFEVAHLQVAERAQDACNTSRP